MADEDAKSAGNLFLQMVLTLQTSAMQHLGKIASPFTGQVERDLLSAKAAIDMLAMLKEKTQGNLNEAESRILDRVIYELQMNYVDEANKPEPQPDGEGDAQDAASTSPDGGGEESTGEDDRSSPEEPPAEEKK